MRGVRYKSSVRAIAISLAAALGLAGCGGGGDEAEQAAEQAVEAARFAPVDKVLNVEIGRTRNGYLISATGLAPGLGYGAPELRARREGRPGPDGFIHRFRFCRESARSPAQSGSGRNPSAAHHRWIAGPGRRTSRRHGHPRPRVKRRDHDAVLRRARTYLTSIS